jgi:hypothetical protein
MSELRDRIAAALDKALPESAADVGFYQRLGVTPLVDIEAYDLNLESLADAVIREVGLGMKPQEIVEDWHGKCRTYD